MSLDLGAGRHVPINKSVPFSQGNFESTAVRCRACRNKIKSAKDDQKKHMEEMANREVHPNESFFRKRYTKVVE